MKILAVSTGVALWMSAISLVAQPATPSPLKGVTKVTVRVSLTIDPKTPLPVGISEGRLATLVELQFRSAGLRVLSAAEDQADSEDNPFIDLRVDMLGAWVGQGVGTQTGYAFSSELMARQAGMLRRSGGPAAYLLWHGHLLTTASVPDAGASVEATVRQLTDGIVNDWLAANPRRP